jgi:hypothetical protein
MSLAGDALLEPIKKYFQSRSWTVLNDDVRIVIASNSNDAGIIGAALHAMTCFIRTRDDLAFETMISNSSPTTSSVMKASKSVEVLNYMHSNRESGSNKNLSDCVSACIGYDVNVESGAAVSGNRYDVHSFQPIGKLRVSSSDDNNREHTESDNSINHKYSSRSVTITLLVSGALSLFSAYTFGATVAVNRSLEFDRNDNKSVNLIHYSAFFCQICAGSYLLYHSQKHTF